MQVVRRKMVSLFLNGAERRSGDAATPRNPNPQTVPSFRLPHVCTRLPPASPAPTLVCLGRHGLACEQAKRVALALLVGRRRRGSPVLHLGCMLCWLHAACYSVRACASATGARDVPRHSRAAVRACDAQARLGTERARDLQLVHRRRIRHGTDRPALSAPRGNARSARLGSARSSDVLCHCRRFPGCMVHAACRRQTSLTAPSCSFHRESRSSPKVSRRIPPLSYLCASVPASLRPCPRGPHPANPPCALHAPCRSLKS